MVKKMLVGLGIGLFSLTTALPISAQETATLALKNGERPSGELVDMNASGFTLRINGQDRQFSANDVAAVEFVVGPLPAAAQAKVNDGQAVVLLRSGQVIDGRLVDIGGARPLRLTVDTPSGQRDFNSSEVAQVHLAPLNNRVAATTGSTTSNTASIPSNAITVLANQPWTDSGISVVRGMRLQFSGTGDINLAAGLSSGVGGSPAATSATVRYPVPNAPAGALIGRVGNGAPFLIGANTAPIQMPANGRLMLGINDDHVPDNSGQYHVTVSLVR